MKWTTKSPLMRINTAPKARKRRTKKRVLIGKPFPQFQAPFCSVRPTLIFRILNKAFYVAASFPR